MSTAGKARPKAKRRAATARPRAKIKTTVTEVKVSDFIAAIDNQTRREDAKALVKLFSKVSGWPAKMWGPSIIGFGAYHYTYASGHFGTMCAIGFSPRRANLVIYVMDFAGKEDLLAKLGKHKGGLKQCLYISKLADVDTGVLEKLIAGGLAEVKRTWPVTAA